MGFAKNLRFIFLLVLSLGLFCGELPEMFTLIDDASNSFVRDSVAPLDSEILGAREDPSPTSLIFPVREPLRWLLASQLVETTFKSGRELLRLFSVQRK